MSKVRDHSGEWAGAWIGWDDTFGAWKTMTALEPGDWFNDIADIVLETW